MQVRKNNTNRYINNIKSILKDRKEWHDHFHDTIKISQIQKRANLRLFF